jgi:diacylglycerol kinase family enzyme
MCPTDETAWVSINDSPTVALGPGGEGLTVVVNPASGPALLPGPQSELREGLPAARIVELEDPGDLPDALRRAVDDGAVALGVAGGDGSVNCGAEVAMSGGLPLLVVPGGTLNHLAKAIGLDSVAKSVEAASSGRTERIDVARIDDRLFLNTASIGAYVELVDRREMLEHRIGKWPAFTVALVWVLAGSEPVEVEIDGISRRVWLVFFGNNPYDPRGIAPRTRQSMTQGLLDVRMLEARRGWGKVKLLRAALTGRIPKMRAYNERTAESVSLRFLGEEARLSVDGETYDASRAFDVLTQPKALEVFVA